MFKKYGFAAMALALALTVSVTQVQAAEIFVGSAPVAPSVDPVGSLGNPYTDVQSAIDAAVNNDVITISDNISVATKVIINKPLTINGGSNTVTFSSDAIGGWSGNYVFHVYNTTGVVIKDITLTSGDAGLLVNGSSVILEGSVDVSGNEFGGIEVSNNSTFVSTGTLTNTDETYGLPTIWQDGGTNTLTVSGLTEITKGSQKQYYKVLENTNTVTVTTEAQLVAALADTNISTIIFGTDITAVAIANVTRPVTIKTSDKTLTGGILIDSTSNVTIKGLIVTNPNGHGINVYNSTNVLLDSVTVSNNSKSGVTVNASSVTVKDITTSNNGWGGINVGKTTASTLTVNGKSTHSEKAENSAIWIDTPAEQGTVVDTDSQYTMSSADGKQRYSIRVAPRTRVVGGGGGGSSSSSNTTITTPVVTTPTTTPSTTPTPEGQVLGETTFNFTVFMKAGSSNKTSVMELQKFLNAGNFGVLAVDGSFGPKTKAAVMAFQRANLLVADGIVGPKTLAALNK